MFPDLEPVARAFALLARGRPVSAGLAGFAEGPIPLAEIAAYTTLFPVPDPEEFVLLLRAMDEAYLSARAEQRARSTEKDRKDARPPPRPG